MPARTPSFSGQFKRDLKLAKRRGKNMGELETLLGLLVDGEPLPERWVRLNKRHKSPIGFFMRRIAVVMSLYCAFLTNCADWLQWCDNAVQ